MDPKVNGQLQKEWGWLIAIYLFLGGIGGGAYTIAAVNSFLGESMRLATTVGLWIGFPALLVGSIVLLADLGNPGKFIFAGLKPGTSWIARGFWIISLFMLFSFIHLYSHDPSGGKSVPAIVPILGIVFAVGTMAYTGILLGASKGIPFWRSGVVPVVFVISALVTGHFFIMLGMVLFNDGAATASQLNIMAGEALVLVVAEVLAIFFFLQAAWKHPDAKESAERILRNRIFVVGYFLLGLLLPLIIMLIIYYGLSESGMGAVGFFSFVGAVLGLAGGLILRQCVLICGALPTLNIGGFKFRRIARPKDPKAGIGMLPPK